jgi:hypothetical protein
VNFFYQSTRDYAIPDGVCAVVRNRGPGKYEVGARFRRDPDDRWHWCSLAANSKVSAMRKAPEAYRTLAHSAAARIQEKAAELYEASRQILGDL